MRRRRRLRTYEGFKPGDRIIYTKDGVEKPGYISSWMLPNEPRRGVWIHLDDDPENKIDVGMLHVYLRKELEDKKEGKS